MNRRQFLAKAASLSGCLLAGGCAVDRFGKHRENRPNIILLMADEMGYGDTGFNGSTVIKTPALDEMAASGIRFTRFYSGAPVCSPTRGTCLTGRHNYRYGIFSASAGYLPAEEITLARITKSMGYTTGHFGKWHLGPVSKEGLTMPEYEEKRLRKYCPPWERDYDESLTTECNVPTWNPTQTGGYKWVFSLPFWENGKVAEGNLEGPASAIVMDRAVDFVGRAVSKNQPFFATIWFHEPHDPVVAGPQYRAMYSQYDEGRQHYCGCITAMDEQVGRLRQKLRELGIAENTMVWFCSDNGPEGRTGQDKRFRGFTGGLRGRKRSLFEGGLRVPALLEWPGHVRRGRVVDTPCSTLDCLPTITDLLGFEMPDNRPIDGVSIFNLIDGSNRKRRSAIPFAFHKASLKGRHGSPSLALVSGKWKFLTDLSPTGEEDMLFDLQTDPSESNNILADHSDIAEAMKSHLRSFMESCRKSHAGEDYPGPFEPVNEFPVV